MKLKINRLLPKFIKKFIKSILFIGLRLFAQPNSFGDKHICQTFYLSDGQNPVFFGYHDKTPFNQDNTKILAMSIPGTDTNPKKECTPIKLGYFSRNGSESNNIFQPFAATTTWCWQQGCMLQWYPGNSVSQVIYNDLADGKYGSRIFDVDTKKEIKCYEHPVYSLDSSGKLALSLNFSRLGRLRPGYGYNLLNDETAYSFAPVNDGLFLFDLDNGEKKLLVSLAELAVETGGCPHYINHASFSPDGKYIVFFHLWIQNGQRHANFCGFDMKDNTLKVLEQKRRISHYCWRDESSFVMVTIDAYNNLQYTLYSIAGGTKTDLNLPLQIDGHPMFHPKDKNIMITDTYPDRRGDQHLCVIDINTKQCEEIEAIYSPLRYRGQVRCDLHPRWDRTGKYIAVDCTNKEHRRMALLEYQ
jgi:hypothetical protein